MRKTIVAIFVLAACSISSVSAQISLSELLKGKIGTVEELSDVTADAVRPELSVIRQQYRLKLKDDYYGKDNMAYFGETYTLAVKIPGATLISGRVVEPWKDDADYRRINADGKYTPVLFWSYQRKLTDSLYSAVDLEIGSEFTTPVNAGKSLYSHVDKFSDFGLGIDNTLGEKSGAMLWAVADNPQDSAMTVRLRQSSMTIEVKADSTLVPMSPKEPEKTIGGIYVVPKYDRGGRVQYMLAGMAVRLEDGKWALQLCLENDAATEAELTKSEAEAPEPQKKDAKKKGRK